MVGLAPGQLILECSVEAEPAPKIEWHRDGILLQVGARLGTWGHHLLCRSGPRPCRLDLGAKGLPRASTSRPRSPGVLHSCYYCHPVLWMGTLRQGWDLQPGF